MNTGLRLKEVRERIGMSQYRLAKVSGISQSTISDIENGKMSPSVDTMYRLCSALGVTLSEFFSDEQPSSDRISRLTPEQRQALDKFLETLEKG